jgi:L-asparagine oxygenase
MRAHLSATGLLEIVKQPKLKERAMSNHLLSSAERQWSHLQLSAHDHDHLTQSALCSTLGWEHNSGAPGNRAHETWPGLTKSLRTAIRAVATGTSERPELFITGLPVDINLGSTPTVEVPGLATPSRLSEFLMFVISAGLGSPISYRDQRAGYVFHDIFPTRANAHAVSSQSSSAVLGYHTEMFFHPEPPDFLMLYCLRADPADQAVTAVASVADVMRGLSTDEQRVLRQQQFALDLARLHGTYQHDGRAIGEQDPRPVFAVVEPRKGGVRFRFEPALTTPLTTRAKHALEHADELAAEVSVVGKLLPGTILIIDNRRSAHSRSRFPAKFDGTDR